MTRDSSKRLSQLPKEVESLLRRGHYQLFEISDPQNQNFAFVLQAKPNLFFILDWEGTPMKKVEKLPVENIVPILFPYPEMERQLKTRLNNAFS